VAFPAAKTMSMSGLCAEMAAGELSEMQRQSLKSRLLNRLGSFPPVYFSMIMATGIVSIAVHLVGIPVIGSMLLRLNVALYFAFWVLLIGASALIQHRCCRI
jgi:hypothetical protein